MIRSIKDILDKYHKTKKLCKCNLLKQGIPCDKHSLALWKLKNTHTGQKCLIVGNGPSSSIEYLDRVSGVISFGMNQIYRIFPETTWRPDYYAISSTVLAENYGKDILASFNGSLLASNHLHPILGDNPRIIYFNKEHEDYDDELPEFSSNCLNIVNGGYTTAYLCMQLAWHFGMRDFLTMGLDASYDFSKVPTESNVGKFI
jgi:hypothetical protein